ncbi:MAG: alpha/beta hydrolase, partial [Clostridia bacterium]|nr:alpha/beta hydrolase [Clostridia bacterium]
MHGYLSKKESFYYQTKFFSASFRVTAPDFPGFGASAPLTEAWSVGDYADWLEKFIKAAGLNNPVIIAHSFGARVALKYLAKNPCAAEKLVLTGGAGLVKPRTKKYTRRVKAYRIVKRFFPKLAEKRFGSPEY